MPATSSDVRNQANGSSLKRKVLSPLPSSPPPAKKARPTSDHVDLPRRLNDSRVRITNLPVIHWSTVHREAAASRRALRRHIVTTFCVVAEHEYIVID